MFLHDRVQQAAYSLIEPAQLPGILLKIGRLLLARLQPEQLAEKLYEVANDLNAGRQLMQDTAEQVQALELNLSRGAQSLCGHRLPFRAPVLPGGGPLPGNPRIGRSSLARTP